VAAGGGVKHRRERDEHHIGRVRREIAHHGDERHRRRQQEFRRAAHAFAHGAGEKPRALRDARAQHHHQHVAQRMKVGERLRHLHPEPLDVFRRQQTDRAQHDAIAGFIGLRGVQRRIAHQRGADAEGDQDADQPKEDEHRIGQLVARTFDESQKAFRRLRLFSHA
jgi:hypothetical protein